MMQELMEGGGKHLAVQVGDTARGRALTRILALKTSPGWHVKGSEIREWRFEGLAEKDGAPLLYGPHVAGRALVTVLDLPLPAGLAFLSRLAQALRLLAERRIPWFPLQTDSVVFEDREGVLFLPPDVMREIRDLNSFELSRESYESINHPDLKGEVLWSFSIAALLYRISTGRFPFTGTDAEEMHEHARKLEIDAPSGIVPELDPELSALVMAGLGKSRRGAVSLVEWSEKLGAWQKKDLYRVLPPAEREKALQEALVRQHASGKSFRRRMFWENNWKIIGVIVIAAAVVGAGAGSILKNMLAPRLTRGYPPQKIVETFYDSMNTLDHQTMQSCVIGAAGKGEINEVTVLYVTSKVTQGYQGKSTIISAADWDKRGRPKLENPSSLFGVTGLSVVQEQGEPGPVYRAQYDLWNPAPPADVPGGLADTASAAAQAAPRSEGHRVTDRLWLKQDKGDWVIYRIERLRQDLLPPPELAQVPTPAPAPGAPTQ
jgi:hypothetical protein